MTEREFAVLYDDHVATVRTVLYRMGARAQLDDLTQEVFLKAWRGQAGFRQHSSPRTWLCRISRNVAIDALRTGRVDRQQTGVETLEQTAAPDVDPQERALVLHALSRLEPDDRLLLVLLTVEECTMSEIGEILDIPAGTVKSRAFALRQRLQALQEMEGAAV